MLKWFSHDAPIRIKFRVLALVYGVTAIGIAVLAIAPLAKFSITPLWTLTLATTGVVAMVAITLAASRLICTPYVETVVRMERLAAGDLDSPVAYTENRDCVGRLTKAMAAFRESALAAREADTQRQMASIMGAGLDKLATGDLTVRIDAELQEPFLKLRNDFNAAAAALLAAMRSVATTVSDIRKGAGEISAASNDMSQRTEQQAASLEQTAAAMEQITATVRETANNAGRANQLVTIARAEAVESGEIVHRAVAAMSRIEQHSAEISDIISVIDGIAFQTNLLALNAGVEAARAGDAGKGFAVVASEVRALAQRSAEAAKDVKQRVTASSETVDVGVTLVSETGRSLERIIARIGEISGFVADITSASEQQSQGLSQVNTAVSEMDGVTQRNAAMVEQSTAAARSLASEADALAAEIARFKLDLPHVRPIAAIAAPVSAGSARPLRRTGSPAVQLVTDDWSEF